MATRYLMGYVLHLVIETAPFPSDNNPSVFSKSPTMAAYNSV